MVTLLGFFFIIGNVILIEIYMPDLVGPVRTIVDLAGLTLSAEFRDYRVLPGCTIALHLAYGCELSV